MKIIMMKNIHKPYNEDKMFFEYIFDFKRYL